MIDARKLLLSHWKRMGYSKGTLHYLKKNARSEKPFKIYGKGREKLKIWMKIKCDYNT